MKVEEQIETKKIKWQDSNRICECLAKGGVVLLPTETVWGLVAIQGNAQKINAIKKSPDAKPLTQFVANIEQVRQIWGVLSDRMQKMVARWPAPLTVIAGEKETVAIRMPDFLPLLELIASTGPLLSTSANLSGEPAPCRLNQVHEDILCAVDLIVDESCPDTSGLSSTIVQYKNNTWTLIRQGQMKLADLLDG